MSDAIEVMLVLASACACARACAQVLLNKNLALGLIFIMTLKIEKTDVNRIKTLISFSRTLE